MVPGKKYRPEDFARVLKRRVWLVLVPFAIVSAATAAIARKLPDWYRSDSLILVVPQRVPEGYVKSTVTTRIEDRLQSITQQILSRTRLERIIQDFDLYAADRRAGIMEDIVDRMRKDIDIQVIKGDAFRVSYIGREPRTVMKVTERLASLFIEESLRDREVLAEGTSQFLEAQLADARRRLVEDEKKVETYRKKFSGELPSQLESNLQVIQNTQMQIHSVLEALNRDQDRRLIIDRQIAELESRPVEAPAETTVTITQQLTAAKSALTALELRLTTEHPDVQRMKRTVQDLQAKADAEALMKPLSNDTQEVLPPAEALRRRRLQELRTELVQLDQQIAHKQEEEKRLRASAGSYQQRIDMAPTRESELAELTRDYSTLQTLYANLLTKKEESQIAANLERRQIGEQFKLLDPARLAEKPFRPNRQLINILGMVGGLAFGIGMIAFLEYRDASFKTDDEVTSVLTLSVLAVIPLMQSAAEKRRAARRRFIVSFGLGSTVVGCIAVLVYTFVR
jgi:polysaccharide chain length determinant protein (PEP-CTERM system associated)